MSAPRFVEVSSCVLCGSRPADWQPILRLNDQQNLVECSTCRLVFNDRQRHDLDQVYGDQYFVAESKGDAGGFFDYGALEAAVQKDYGFASRFIREQCAVRPGPFRILDVGCGYGHFVKQFVGDPRFSVHGVELNTMAAEQASRAGIRVHNVVFEQFEPAEPFDFVVCFGFLEHVFDPAVILAKARAICHPDGFVFLSLPNVGNPLFRLLGTRWPAVQPACHNWYFRPRTLEALGRKSGLEIVEMQGKQFIRRDVRHFRKRLAELFPALRGPLGLLAGFDGWVVPFPSGGELDAVLRPSRPEPATASG